VKAGGGLFVDRVHRLPRRWSNQELRRFASLFHGEIVNVSAWKDVDKEGRHYRDYFSNATSYTITNYKAEFRGLQGAEGEIYLDLEQDLPAELVARWDVVFNHTTLEHVYDFRSAFDNLCRMTRDVLIVVVPFLQPYHSDYGDYWRFSPLAIKRMLEERGVRPLYVSFNGHLASAVYVFAIGSRQPERWAARIAAPFGVVEPTGAGKEPFIGCNALPGFGGALRYLLRRLCRS